MKTAPLVLTLFATAGLFVPSTFAAESRYTNLGNKGCQLDRTASRQIKPHEDFKPMLYRCSGLGDRQVSVTYHGLQVRTTFARKGGKNFDLLAPYDAGPKVEWRGAQSANGFTPTTAIVRLSARDDNGRPASALAIVRLTPEQDCLVAVIDVKANRNANELAQQTADAAAGSGCAVPRKIGNPGSSGDTIWGMNTD